MSPDPSLSAPDTALRVLARVEDLDVDATGALVFDKDAVVLVDRGRVCWATAPGLRRRLSDLLRAACTPPLSSEEVEQLFVRCKAEGTRFGETLVALGRLSSTALRAALLQHTSEALAIPEAWRATPRWVAHRGALGYASDYTFVAVELLAHVSAAAQGQDVASDALARLRDVVGDRQGAIFDRRGERLISCQLASGASGGLRALRAAGAWAAASVDGDAAVVKYTAVIDGAQWLGWRVGAHTFLARCVGRDDFSSMVRSLHQHGFTAAVWSSVPFDVPPSTFTTT